jgi:hypothetical protein
VTCQDVYDLDLTTRSVLTIRVSNVSIGSVSQLAPYGPGVALGGVNLLTGTTNELRCTDIHDCSAYTAGEHVDAFTANQSGKYRLAVTQDWGASCEGAGTYRLDVGSTQAFHVRGQTVNDQPSHATGYECR